MTCVWLSLSCSRFQSIRKSTSWREKYQAALSYYEASKYNKAGLLLEDILPLVRGMKEGEEALFTYAYTQYHQAQYLVSAEYFKTFAQTYPRSERTEEANYMYAYSSYLTTEPYYLDPSYTYTALSALQSFIEAYPSSSYRSEAQRMVNELQERLAKKAFVGAKQYYKLSYYKAAHIALKDFRASFPDASYVEESSYLSIKSLYFWAAYSIPSKQLSRYRSFCASYEDFVDTYPESSYLGELEQLYAKGLSRITALNLSQRAGILN